MIIEDLYRQLFGRGGTTKGHDIDMAEHGRTGGISTGQPFKFVDNTNYEIKLVESGNYTYIAYANPGTAEATAAWKVMRIDTSGGMKITWCDNDTNFDNVATDLPSLFP
jgi:hypothetical protein